MLAWGQGKGGMEKFFGKFWCALVMDSYWTHEINSHCVNSINLSRAFSSARCYSTIDTPNHLITYWHGASRRNSIKVSFTNLITEPSSFLRMNSFTIEKIDSNFYSALSNFLWVTKKLLKFDQLLSPTKQMPPCSYPWCISCQSMSSYSINLFTLLLIIIVSKR